MKSLLPLLALFALYACEKEPVAEPTTETVEDKTELVGTSWVITRYDNATTTNVAFPNDTLNFTGLSTYNINDTGEKNYYLKEWYDNGNLELKLFDCTTFGDTYASTISETILEDGELNNRVFGSTSPNSEDVFVWMEKI